MLKTYPLKHLKLTISVRNTLSLIKMCLTLANLIGVKIDNIFMRAGIILRNHDWLFNHGISLASLLASIDVNKAATVLAEVCDISS